MAASDLIISVSGLRGVVGDSLTPEVAQRFVAAFAAGLPPGGVVVGRDGRESGPLFAEAIVDLLTSTGRAVLDAGAAATPTIGVLVRQHGAAGGIQISASHNPPQYNGIKLFNSTGRVIPAVDGQQVLERYRDPAFAPPAIAAGSGRQSDLARVLSDATTAHLKLIERTCDVRRIRERRFRVLLDVNHGAGGQLGQVLLERLGCEVEVLGGTPDGAFEHVPEPTEANLSSVLQQVVAGGFDIGFCQDPDADRLAIIDERGRYIGEEKTPALCVEHVLRSGARGPVVTNCSTSRMSEDLAARYGVPFQRSKVGEANVVDLMLSLKAAIGGEGNGGVIDPRVGMVRDSFVGMAIVLDAMAANDSPVSVLADQLPHYAIHKTTIAVAPTAIPEGLARLERHFADATADRLDGLRLDFPSKAWLLVRPSNTEPIVRAIAEATTATEAQELCATAARLLA